MSSAVRPVDITPFGKEPGWSQVIPSSVPDADSFFRIVKGEKGKVAFHTELILRFAYGAIVPWVTRIDDVTLRAIAGPDMAVLHTPARMRGENFKTIGDFTVTPGEEQYAEMVGAAAIVCRGAAMPVLVGEVQETVLPTAG